MLRKACPNVEANLEDCNCTYSCDLKGKCCECIRNHLPHGELPACFFPPAGILVGFWRAFLWGLLLAPTTPQFALVMIPHGLTLLLEGQAYILAIFAACRLGQVLLWPESLGLTSRWRAYLAGLREMALVCILVAIVLLVSAIWEAFEVIYIVAPLAGGL